jgi:hypothetical protein
MPVEVLAEVEVLGTPDGRGIIPSIFSEKARRQAWHSHAPCPVSLGRRFSSPQ